MKKFFQTLHRFVPPYKWYLVGNVFANITAALLNLFSFALIIPILRILFKIDKAVYQFIPWSDLHFDSIAHIKETTHVFSNNFNYYLTSMIDTKGGSYTLIVLGIFLVISTLFKVGFTYLSFFCMIPIRTGIVRDIRNSINNKILKLHLGFFSEESKGDIIARITGDVNEVETSIMSSLDMMIKNPIMIIIFLIGMIIISPKLTLFVFILLPISGFIMGQVGKKLKRTSFEGQTKFGQLISMVEETLGGLRVIKAFNAESMIRKRFEQHNDLFRSIIMRVFCRQQLAHPMSEFLGTATIAIVLWYGGTLILSNDSSIDAGTFIYYLVIFYSIINPAKELSRSIYAIQKGMASLDRVDKILLATSKIQDPKEPKELHFNEAIRFDKVSFKYRDAWVLKDISLTIPKGQMVAIVGASGSGKSTLVDLIPRFYDVQEGRVLIDDTDVREVRMHDLRQLMGNVNQEAILFNDTIYNNIVFGTKGVTPEQVEEAARIANAEEFITQLPEGYQTNIGDRGGKLSGGQRQRLSIARAVLKNPDILILDEATSALDTSSERLVQEALEHLMKGRTTVVIAHRLSTIVGADTICVLHEGRIVEQGSHEELLAKEGHYATLCRMQQF